MNQNFDRQSSVELEQTKVRAMTSMSVPIFLLFMRLLFKRLFSVRFQGAATSTHQEGRHCEKVVWGSIYRISRRQS
jgi:hypothetical protein